MNFLIQSTDANEVKKNTAAQSTSVLRATIWPCLASCYMLARLLFIASKTLPTIWPCLAWCFMLATPISSSIQNSADNLTVSCVVRHACDPDLDSLWDRPSLQLLPRRASPTSLLPSIQNSAAPDASVMQHDTKYSHHNICS